MVSSGLQLQRTISVTVVKEDIELVELIPETRLS